MNVQVGTALLIGSLSLHATVQKQVVLPQLHRVALVQSDDERIVRLNGGMEAEIMKMGRSRNHRQVTFTVRLKNGGPNTAFLLLARNPVATDSAGVIFSYFDSNRLGGVSFCHNLNSLCIGIPEKTSAIVPLQDFTQLSPGNTTTINFALQTNEESTGRLLSLNGFLLPVRFRPRSGRGPAGGSPLQAIQNHLSQLPSTTSSRRAVVGVPLSLDSKTTASAVFSLRSIDG